MAGRRLSSIAIVAAVCAGAAAWFSAGALAVIDAGPGAPRAGVLPPLWTLPLLMAGSCAIAWIVRLPRDRAWPLFFPLLAVLPWVPAPMPLALWMWSGPIVLFVWAIAIAGIVLVPTPRPPAGTGTGSRRLRGAAGWLLDSTRAPLIAAALAFALYAGAAAHQSFAVSGDEPHYLIITQSILHDFDLRIENNHRAGQFTSYVPGELKPDYLRRGRDGQIYSIHAPGLPALLAPAYAFFGYRGAILLLALASALATGLAWRACAAVTASAAAAWFGWGTVALTAPFFFQSFAVYPEGLGGAIVMAGVLVSMGAAAAPANRLFWCGAALALLPWLHTRFAIPAAALGLAIVARVWSRLDRTRAVALFVAIPVASAIGWLAFFHAVYGSVSPAAPYGGYTQSALGNVPRGLGGLLLDQQFGVVPNAPVYAVALAGFVTLWRRSARLAVELLVLTVPYALAASSYHMWWGGHSTPGRFLVAVLLPLSVPAACAFERARSRTGRSLMVLALVSSATITAVLLFGDRGRLLFNARDGSALWLEWVAPLVDLPRGVPSFLRDPPGVALLQSAWWLALIAAASAGAIALERIRSLDAGRRMLASAAALAAAVPIAVSGLWMANGIRAPTATTAQLAVLRHVARLPQAVAVKFSPLQVVGVDAVVGRLDVGPSARRPREPGAPDLDLARVPAGVYRLHVRAPAGFTGTLEVRAGESDLPIEAWPVSIDRGRDTDLRLVLPVAATALDVRRATPEGEGLEVTLRPQSILARHMPGEAFASARYGAFRTFLVEGTAYLEPDGMWLSAGATVMVVDPTARSLFVRNTTRENVVRIGASGITERLDLRAREERTVTLPPSAEAYGLLHVTVAEAVVPAIVDPASADYRSLGLWVEVRARR